jgi:BASS family bile acid:Na+ symporter
MTAQQLFNALFNGGIVVMIVALVLSLGMGFTVTQVLAPVRRVGVMAVAIIVNCVLAPAVAWGVCSLFGVTTEQRIAIVLLTAAAAGPVGLKSCEFAKRADMALAVSLVVILQLVNIIAAPLWAKAVVTNATVDTWMIVKDLLLLVLVPLVLGLAAKARYSEHADRWKPALERTSNIALVVAIVSGVAVYWHDIIEVLGSRVIVAAIVIIVVIAALPWALLYRHLGAAVTVSMVSAMRFTPIGLVVIMTQLKGAGAYLAPALVFALVDTFVPLGLGLETGRVLSRRPKKAEQAGSARAA